MMSAGNHTHTVITTVGSNFVKGEKCFLPTAEETLKNPDAVLTGGDSDLFLVYK